jgi:hypothetical protein
MLVELGAMLVQLGAGEDENGTVRIANDAVVNANGGVLVQKGAELEENAAVLREHGAMLDENATLAEHAIDRWSPAVALFALLSVLARRELKFTTELPCLICRTARYARTMSEPTTKKSSRRFRRWTQRWARSSAGSIRSTRVLTRSTNALTRSTRFDVLLEKLRASSLVHKEIAKRLGIDKLPPPRTAARLTRRAR